MMIERLVCAMKKFPYLLLMMTVLCLASPLWSMAEPFTSPFVRFGMTGPSIAPYMPKFDKPRQRPDRPQHPDWPQHSGGAHHPNWWQGRYLLFPYSGCCQDNYPAQIKTSTPPKPATRQSIVLDPAIFNPEPKTPLTLIIEDGVVVERYRGY